MNNRLVLAAAAAATMSLAGCVQFTEPFSGVDRMYVINCGENHVPDVSRWTPGVNVGKPHVFANHCYLIRHRDGWFLWDSGNADRLAALPRGQTGPTGITAMMKKPLVESLKEIGVAPGDIAHFAMSHFHGDHSGNANLFAGSTVYMQEKEYAVVFGPDAQKSGVVPANFEKLKGARFVQLNGDHDVFGDGTVLIKSAPGHTVGHQVLVVRLPRTGRVMLTGDMVHLTYSWQNRVVPGFNFDIAMSGHTIDRMQAWARENNAQVWVNHDMEQHAKIPKAPDYVR